jgi:hypothetical protein
MSTTLSEHGVQESGNSLYAALARTATRSVALYFSRPVGASTVTVVYIIIISENSTTGALVSTSKR